MTPIVEVDRQWMEEALALAALGEGTTSPNPRVGCVLVRDGSVVGQGYHRVAGEPHAEALALADAGGKAAGATLYVNLEPCAHHGRTPPCVDRIIDAGVRRVVAAITDPNPLVNGQGFERLRGAGVRVDIGLLGREARRLNRGFLHWHSTGRPWVTVKAAVSLDGMIAAKDGESRWITSPVARRFAHRLRLRHDAILVGAETVRRDDPRLTVRLPGLEATRLRVVLTSTLDLDPGARIFDAPGDRASRVYVPEDCPDVRVSELARRADVRRVPREGDGIDLLAAMGDLGNEGVQSVLVEGGAKTTAAFLRAGLADEVAVFVAPLLIGSRGGTPMLDLPSVTEPALGLRLRPVERLPLGPDLLLMGELVGAATDSVNRKGDAACSPD